MSPGRRKLLVCFLIILLLGVPLWPGFDEPASPMEEGALLVYPELILKGQLPYRDFETFYGPANLLVPTVVYAATGPSIFAERGIGLLYRLLIFSALFVLIQRWSTTLAAASVLIAGLVFVPLGVPAYAWIGAVACALWSLWLISKTESARSCLFGGVLGAAALLFRPDLAPAMVASGLPLFLLMSPARRWRYVLGVALGLLPLALLMLATGPREMLNNLFLFPVLYSNPGRRLPIFQGEAYLIYLFFVHMLAVVVNLVAGALAIRRDRRDPSARLLLGLALLGLGLTHQATQRFDFGHLVSAALLSISLLPVAIFVIRRQNGEAPGREKEGFLAGAVALLLLLAAIPELMLITRGKVMNSLTGATRGQIFVQHQGRTFPVYSPRGLRLWKGFWPECKRWRHRVIGFLSARPICGERITTTRLSIIFSRSLSRPPISWR